MDIHKLLDNGNVDYDELSYNENGNICRLAGRDAHHSGWGKGWGIRVVFRNDSNLIIIVRLRKSRLLEMAG